MKITYFVHSTSVDNEAGIRSGWSDIRLSETGFKQAHELREHVAGLAVDGLFCSDLERAVRTAAIAFPHIPATHDPRLREMNYGDLNGHPHGDFPADPFQSIHTRLPNGESCLDMEERMRDFLREQSERHTHIAIIAHRYTHYAIQVICNGMTWEEAIMSDWQWQPGWTYHFRVA